MLPERIREVNITEEMKSAFIDYAMSVIVSRALPDVRDGLKPVHRRILYAMLEAGMTPDQPYRKSAAIVGDVLGKYHPHGDAAVYDAMVRMAQDFSYRYPLVDGQGNFGSIDGDGAAAMRYTEARLSPLAMELLRDIQKDTVDFQDNYDGRHKEPVVLPARFPHLLANGASGIAVGMATNIPPHNLGELIDAAVFLLDHPEADGRTLLRFVKGPDFPTGGLILGRKGIEEAYLTGKGSIVVRAKVAIDVEGGRTRLIVQEIPYLVNKARLIERIAELVRDKRLEGISDLRDESDREGVRIVIELRRDANPHVVLNHLFKHTALQTSFGVLMLALVDGRPEVLTLKEALLSYLTHQRDVVRRRTAHDLAKAEARLEVVHGLMKAIDIVDDLVDRRGPIRAARTREEALRNLMAPTYRLGHRDVPMGFTEAQAKAILDMRLEQLTGLSIERLTEERERLEADVARHRHILADPKALDGVIREELLEIKARYGDERRTKIVDEDGGISDEDLVDDAPVVISLTDGGYIKRVPAATYRSQRRGGRGVIGMGMKADDVVRHVVTVRAHDTVLFFTDRGRVYRLRAYDVPEAGRTARGTALVNLLPLLPEEKVAAVVGLRTDAEEERALLFVTRDGLVKRTPLREFQTIRRGGLIALTLREDDALVAVRPADDRDEVILGTQNGLGIRFSVADVRPMGRTAAGVKGIDLADGDAVVGAAVLPAGAEEGTLLVVTEHGYGKRTPLSEFRLQARGGRGVRTIRRGPKTGRVIGVAVVRDDDDLLVVDEGGVVIRMPAAEIPVMGRDAQGVRLMRLDGGGKVAAFARVAEDAADEA
ncbi:MAG: DNA gyrase subunit A [Hydrogenibacillus schlegelii]|nr:DNA gyrase subunit A [Hydrogenibacillus schlegelii]